MKDACVDNVRVREVLTQIEHHIGRQPQVFKRPLETGPAEEAGVAGFLIPVSATLTFALFIIPGAFDDTVTGDLFAHARSAGVTATVLLLPDNRGVWYQGENPGDQLWIKNLCLNPEGQGFSSQKGPCPSPGLCESLIRYLTDIRKEINGWFYRREGETSTTLRDLTVQTVIHQVLLTRISLAHGMVRKNLSGKTLWSELCTYATSVPVHDPYDIRALGTGDDETDRVVQRLAAEPSSELNNIRLSWVEPDTWAEVFGRNLATLAKKHHTRTASFTQLTRGTPIIPRKTLVGQIVTEALADEINRFIPGRIYDPAAGCGQMIALILRITRIRSSSSGRIDTIISRLICAGDTVHASDASSIHIATIRFVVVTWIIGGDLRDPSLMKNPLWYPVMSLNDHIRAGSILYGDDLTHEYVSPQAGFPAIRQLHPLDPADLNPGGTVFDLILTCPEGVIPSSVPEITSYLTKRYQSFQRDVPPSALICERITDQITVGGAVIVLIPSCWLSEAAFLGFRRWMRRVLPAGIMLEDEAAGKIDLKELSAIIYRREEISEVRVIRSQKGDDGCTPRDYSVLSKDLPEDDGWRLEDPWEEKILKDLSDDKMPLAEYLFDEMYPRESGKGDIGSPEGWTSICCSAGAITIHQGDTAHQDATSIIPGRDQYLIGLLHSSLIRWYAEVSLRGMGEDKADIISWIRCLPIRTIDHYCDEDYCASLAIEKIMCRLAFLTRQKKASRAWHDWDRLDRQIMREQEDLDIRVCCLYGISTPDCLEIRRRTRPIGVTSRKTTGILIFSGLHSDTRRDYDHQTILHPRNRS